MTIITKNGKIIAVDKKLIQSLNTDLSLLSSIINQLELQLSAITHKPLILNDQTFTVSKKELLTTENIEIFELIPSEVEKKVELSEILPKTVEPKIEPLQNEEPLEIKLGSGFEENFETPLNEPKLDTLHDYKVENIELSKNFSIEEPVEVSPLQENKQEPAILPKEPEKMEISISFEDEFAEIEKMLNLTPEEAQKQLQSELETAAKELDIDYDTLYDFKEELFDMLNNEKQNLFKAIENKNYDEIHKIAHKLKGAALNLRLSNLALILKKIDELSKNKRDLHKIEYLSKKFYNFLEKIENVEKPKPKIPKEIKQLILKTIDEYLSTQNEKKFKKDLQYIQKLLNVKVETIEDLQEIIKG